MIFFYVKKLFIKTLYGFLDDMLFIYRFINLIDILSCLELKCSLKNIASSINIKAIACLIKKHIPCDENLVFYQYKILIFFLFNTFQF